MRVFESMINLCLCLLVCWHQSSFIIVTADTTSLRQKFSALKIDAIFPGDPNYVKFSTSFNKRFTYKPAAIVFPSNANAVASSVKVGVGEKLPISPRSGGHSYAAYGLGGSDGYLVIDLGRINGTSVNRGNGEAVVGAGSRLGDVAIGLNNQGGRAVPHGVCPYVGLGGHAAFGGRGFTSRLWGLTIDKIIGIEVVLANSSIVSASSTVNPDLFWALRGAGASFGIMTQIRFQTVSAPSEATNYAYDWELNEADFGQALIKLQTFSMSNLSPELGMTTNIKKSNQNGRLQFSFTGVWYGTRSSFASVVQPFLSKMPNPSRTSVNTADWITSLQGTAGNQALSTSGVDLTSEHDTFYAKSLTTPQSTPMTNSSLIAFAKYLANQGLQSNTVWFVQIELFGGKGSATAAVGADETSYAQRSALLTIQFYASSSNFAPPYPNFGLTFLDNMVASIVNNNPSGWQYGAYANYVDDRLSPSQWKSLYFNNHYDRLTRVKRAYDPQNIFVYPQSITES